MRHQLPWFLLLGTLLLAKSLDGITSDRMYDNVRGSQMSCFGMFWRVLNIALKYLMETSIANRWVVIFNTSSTAQGGGENFRIGNL